MQPAGTYVIMAPGIKSPYLLLPASTRFLVQKYLPVILQDEELVLPWNVCVPKAGIRANTGWIVMHAFGIVASLQWHLVGVFLQVKGDKEKMSRSGSI